MSKTLQSALAPLFIISSFCCLVLFEYPLGQPRPYFFCLYGLVVWSDIVYDMYPAYIYKLYHMEIRISDITDLTVILSILISLYRYKELKICLRELNVVNDTLEALGAPNEYQRLRNLIIRIIIGCIVYVFSDTIIGLCMYRTFHIKRNLTVRDVRQFLKGGYKIYVNISSALICGTVLGYICSRFHQVNVRLLVLYTDFFENNADYRCRKQNKSILVQQHITGAEYRKQSTWIMM
ncbi:hypothetical protein ALC62_00695 [Cyphomyrmex costatus]|uniref:Uncharacterized protein n=1 Tax=Cyphomyrmex costatus TaxID=456900 RepID=A0A151IQ73_9HYME|nr:hypothetical protein ALC62_00695 [Cyphomyrmex costatus]